MKTFKTLLSLAFILTLFISLSGCKKAPKEDQYEDIKERGYFIVGFDQTFAPMGYRDAEGNFTGFDIEVAKKVANEMNLTVRFQPIDWSMKENELAKGNIDVIWNGYTITDERKEKVAFSDPYLENRQVIVVLASSTINSKDDLKGKMVGAQTASSSYDAVMNNTNLVKEFESKKVYTYKTNDFAFNELDAKRVDAIVVDEILARWIMRKKDYDKYRILEDNFGTEDYGIGFRKEDVKFRAALNNAFNTLKENDSLVQISRDWFGEDIIK